MEKFGIISDLHLGIRNYEHIIKIQTKSDYPHGRIYAIFTAIKIWLKTTGVNKLIILGDVFHKKNRTSVTEVISVKYMLDELIKEFPDLVILIVEGNHDICAEYSLLELLVNDRIKYIGINTDINTELPFNLKITTYKGIKYAESNLFYAIPYYNDFDLVTELLKKLDRDKVVLGHFHFIGANIIENQTITDGIKVLNTIPFIISGHIHLFQVLQANKQDKVLYTGSFCHHSFNDSKNPVMGGIVLDIEDNGTIKDLTYVDNNYGIQYITEKIKPRCKVVVYKLPTTDIEWAEKEGISQYTMFEYCFDKEVVVNIDTNPTGNIIDDFEEYIFSLIKDKIKAEKLIQQGREIILEVIKEYGN